LVNKNEASSKNIGRPRHEKASVEPEIEFRHYDHIPPGQYLAYCRDALRYQDLQYKRHIRLLLWDILADDGSTIARLRSWLNLGDIKGKPRRQGAFSNLKAKKICYAV
jgi:hypothetical protein